MDRRIVWSFVGVAGMALVSMIGSATFSTSETRADGPTRARASGTAPVPPASDPLAAPTGAGPSAPSFPQPQPPGATPGYTAPASPGVAEVRDASVTVQEVLQLRALKRRVGGENLKRLVDALAD